MIEWEQAFFLPQKMSRYPPSTLLLKTSIYQPCSYQSNKVNTDRWEWNTIIVNAFIHATCSLTRSSQYCKHDTTPLAFNHWISRNIKFRPWLSYSSNKLLFCRDLLEILWQSLRNDERKNDDTDDWSNNKSNNDNPFDSEDFSDKCGVCRSKYPHYNESKKCSSKTVT